MANIRVESRTPSWLVIIPAVLAGLGLATWALWPADTTPKAGSPAEMAASSAGLAHTAQTASANPADTGKGLANPIPGAPDNAPADVPLGNLFDLDNHGKLAITSRTKDGLDTVLAAYPKTGPTGKDWLTIEDKLTKDLPKPALQEVMQLLHGMVQLNLGIEQLKAANPNAEAEGRAVEVYGQIKSLRRQNFDTRTADALFADEEQWGIFLLSMQAIEGNAKLSPEAKKRQSTALIDALPADMRTKATQLLSQ